MHFGLTKMLTSRYFFGRDSGGTMPATILVVCPKLLMPQWKEELESKFGIPGILATGNELLEVKVPEGGGAVITTYQSARDVPRCVEPVGLRNVDS
jgi:hypothetical protein